MKMKNMISSKKTRVFNRIMVFFMVACMCSVPTFAFNLTQKVTNFISEQLVWISIGCTMVMAVAALTKNNMKATIITLLCGAVIAAIVMDPQYIATTGQTIFNLIK